MSEIVNEVVRQVTDIHTLGFEDARDYLAFAAMSVGPVATAVAIADYFRGPETGAQGQQGTDIELVRQAAEVRTGRVRSHFRRWGAPVVLGVGLSTMAVNMLQPTVETTTTLEGSDLMLVVDNSYSMGLTRDMDGDVSRLEAVASGVSDAGQRIPEDVRIGITGFGATVDALSPLTTDRTGIGKTVLNNPVDQNGGDVAGALRLSSNVLAGSDQSETPDNVVVLTDGTVTPSQETRATIQALVANGDRVTVVITGTEGGTYKRTEYDPQDTPSGATKEAFIDLEGTEGVEIVEATSGDEISDILTDTVNDAITTKKRIPSEVFKWMGSFLTGMGVLGILRRQLKRTRR